MSPEPRLITVIGRGHSGTRAMSHTLSASGVFMGAPQNGSGDLIPPEAMYEACRVLAPHVRWTGGLDWDFSALERMPIPDAFTALIRDYLKSVLAHPAPVKGWKIPETTLVFPWIRRLFPEARYIFWIRNPRDCIAGAHVTDDLRRFGVAYPDTADPRRRRAISWQYQYALVRATVKPAHWIEVRFEDFVLRQEETLGRLERFLGMPLARIPVRPEAVGRWETDPGATYFPFLESAMREFDYAIPEHAGQPER